MQYRICNYCAMDTSAEEIVFDEKGICNFCSEYQNRDRERKALKLHPGLAWTLYELRKQKGKYRDNS